MTKPIRSLRGVSKSFGSIEALGNVSLDLETGKGVDLVGDNGAGKPTRVKVMSGVHRPDSGQYVFEGSEVHVSNPAEVAGMGVWTRQRFARASKTHWSARKTSKALRLRAFPGEPAFRLSFT